MTASFGNNRRACTLCRILPVLADVLFFVWLVGETAFEHSLFSRVGMVLFLAAVVGLVIVSRRLTLDRFLLFPPLMIAWAAFGLFFALDRGIVFDNIKTMCINVVFVLAAFQYFLLRRDFDAVFNAFMAAVAVLFLIVVVRSWPIDISLEYQRLGNEAGVNPNTLGLLGAYAFGMAFSRVLRGRPIYLLPIAVFLAMILMAKSLKGYAVTAAIAVILLLVRFPKRWGLKLAAMAGALVAFYFIIARIDVIDHIFFHRLRHMLIYIFSGGERGSSGSLEPRMALARVGLRAFREHPVTGIGAGCYRLLEGSEGTYSHNNYVELLASGGVPFLALFYIPQVLGILDGVKKRRSDGMALFLLMAVVQLFMDIGMVSYLDRTALIIPVFLYAAVRIAGNRPNDGERVFSLIKNPCILVRWMSTRGRLKKMPDKLYLRLLYRGCTGKKLHLNPPVTMNEKLQWIKLYDHNPLYPKLADKLCAREYVSEKGLSDTLIPLLKAWDSADEIDFDALPERFVLKCTHDSGSAVVVSDKSTLDRDAVRRFLAEKCKKSYYTAGREWPYRDLTPRIIAEAFIGSEDGKAPDDVKIYCFDGVARVVMLAKNRTKSGAEFYYFDRDFSLLPIGETTKRAIAEGRTFARPEHLDELISVAETLSEGLSELRVDLYDTKGQVWFGETTLFDQSGFATDTGDDGDALLGSYLVLPEVTK